MTYEYYKLVSREEAKEAQAVRRAFSRSPQAFFSPHYCPLCTILLIILHGTHETYLRDPAPVGRGYGYGVQRVMARANLTAGHPNDDKY